MPSTTGNEGAGLWPAADATSTELYKSAAKAKADDERDSAAPQGDNTHV